MATAGPINLFEFEELARDRLSRKEYDRVAGGATDEITLRQTRTVYESITLRPRMLVDITKRDLSTTALGQRLDFPVLVSPSSLHTSAHRDGELATVRATGAAGALMVVSAGSSYTLEEIAKAATGPIWTQQFLYKDRGLTTSRAERARQAGYTAICITMDAKVPGKRERMIHHGYAAGVAMTDSSNRRGADPTLVDLAATWKDLEWFASNTSLPIVAKGVVTAEDARLCVQHGAKAILVSNHGARQLDTTFATVEVLPEIVDAVDGRVDVYLDGGIRRGTDVLKALALGARAASIGRPIFWGLAVNGQGGAQEVLQILRDELALAMAQCGRPNIASIDRSLLGLVSSKPA